MTGLREKFDPAAYFGPFQHSCGNSFALSWQNAGVFMSAASPPPPPPAATNFLALPLHHFVSSAESGLTVCVVVPCVPRHLEHLQEVLASVDAQTEPAAHVVVALSETDADECALVLASLRARTTTPLSLSCVAAPVSTVPHLCSRYPPTVPAVSALSSVLCAGLRRAEPQPWRHALCLGRPHLVHRRR